MVEENFAGIKFYNWTHFFFALREEIFVDCDNLNFFTGVYICGLRNYYSTGKKRKVLIGRIDKYFCAIISQN